jgi:hypothetical protein
MQDMLNEMKKQMEKLKSKNLALISTLKEINDADASKKQVQQNNMSFRTRMFKPFPSSATKYGVLQENLNAMDIMMYKIPIEKFDGKELYPGLGGNFRQWGERFIMEPELYENGMDGRHEDSCSG